MAYVICYLLTLKLARMICKSAGNATVSSNRTNRLFPLPQKKWEERETRTPWTASQKKREEGNCQTLFINRKGRKERKKEKDRKEGKRQKTFQTQCSIHLSLKGICTPLRLKLWQLASYQTPQKFNLVKVHGVRSISKMNKSCPSCVFSSCTA